MSASVSSSVTCPPAEGAPRTLGNYTVLEFLGEGEYGQVAKCFNTKTKEVVAVKLFKDDYVMQVELDIIQHLGNIHPDEVNIVKYIEHFSCEEYHCIVYEILDCSLLDFSMDRPGTLSVSELRPVAQQLLVAFEALKEACIVHADLKPDNIMLVNHQEQPFKVKLIDFGCGSYFSDLKQGVNMMCDAYRAPEVVLGAPLSEALEMWSLGCCLGEGFLGCELFSDISNYDHLRTIIHLLGQPSDEMLQRSVYADKYFLQTSSQWRFKSPIEYQATNWQEPEVSGCEMGCFSNLEDAIILQADEGDEDAILDQEVFSDFVKNLLQINPEERLTVGQALRHPFITMEHLINTDSEYVQGAHDLMSVTLKTSTPAPVENTVEGDPEQDSQSSAASLERPGSSLAFEDLSSSPDDHKISSKPEEPEEHDCPLIETNKDCSLKNNDVSFIIQPVDETNLCIDTNNTDPDLLMDAEPIRFWFEMDQSDEDISNVNDERTAGPGEAEITVGVSSEDLKANTAENSVHKSASFWSAMKKRFGGGMARLHQAMTRVRCCYASRRRSCAVSSSVTCPPAEGAPRTLGNYTVLEFLGKRAYGQVAKCFNTKTKEVVAVKLFKDDYVMQVELDIIQHLGNIHPDEVNIVKYIEYFSCEEYHCIVYEILDCSLLDFSMDRPGTLSVSELRPVAQQLLVAFEALKEARIVHADLKPDNIMLVNHQEQPFKVKLIDFGCGGRFSDLKQGMNMMCDAYRAPEVVLGAPLSEALEMWSLGCCLGEGLLGCQLFSNISNYDHLRTIIHLLGQPSDEMLQRSVYADKYFLQTSSQWRFKSSIEYQATNWQEPEVSGCEMGCFSNLEDAIILQADEGDEDAILDQEVFSDFVKNLLQINPEERLTVGQALRHPFITMEHLINTDSEYVQGAHDLMSVTLKTSTPAPVENTVEGDPEQDSQSSAASLERPGSSLAFEDVSSSPDDHKISSKPEEPEEHDCPLIETNKDCSLKNNDVSFIIQPVDETNLCIDTNNTDPDLLMDAEPIRFWFEMDQSDEDISNVNDERTAGPGEAEITVGVSSEDLKANTAENSVHKSASFWSAMKKRFGGGMARLHQAMTRVRCCYASRRR